MEKRCSLSSLVTLKDVIFGSFSLQVSPLVSSFLDLLSKPDSVKLPCDIVYC